MFDGKVIREFCETTNATKIKTLAQIAAKMDLSWVKKKDYRVIKSVAELKECIAIMQTKRYLAVDTETTGLNIHHISYTNPIRDHLVGICISWKRDQGIYIPVDHVKFENVPLAEALRLLKPILETKEIITHNGIFDGKVFYAYGILLNIKHDTMQLQFNIDSETGRTSRALKSLIHTRYGYWPIEFEDIFEYEKDYRLFRYVDEDVVRIYGCADADHTMCLFEDLIREINPIHLRGYKKDMELLPILMISEYEGKTIDMKLLRTLNDINDNDLNTVEQLIYKFVGRSLSQKVYGHFDNEYYKFNISSAPALANIMFNKLGYPAKGKKKTTIDKKVLKFLDDEIVSSATTKAISESLMQTDLMSDSIHHPELGLSDKDHILINRDVFISKEYGLAMLVQLYRKLYKNKTSFFEPLLTSSFEGKSFTGIKMTRAATFRIIDTVQTLDSRLKKIIAPPEGMYMCGYDYAQIEARVMIGLSNFTSMVERLDSPEADFHRESAASIEKCRPEEISDKVRKKYKPVNFGIPYGLGARSMLEGQKGIIKSKEEFDKLLAETVETIANWKQGMAPVWNLLEGWRDKALVPIPEYEVPWNLKGHKVGRVSSPYGRSRYFILDNMTESKAASIRRKSGNFPIQCYARDIYAQGIISLWNTLVREGLVNIREPDDYSPLGYHFRNKVIFMAYIHDEVQMIIDKSINPKWIMKQVYNNCVIHIEGHPTYYVGASIIKNWYESKAGDHEVPIAWLQQLPADTPKYAPYVDTIQQDIDEECYQYIKQRTVEEFQKLGIDITKDCVMTRKELSSFISYYLIGKVCETQGIDGKKLPKLNYNVLFVASLEKMFGTTIEITDADVALTTESSTEEVVDNFEDTAEFWKMFEGLGCDKDDFDEPEAEDMSDAEDTKEVTQAATPHSNNDESTTETAQSIQRNLTNCFNVLDEFIKEN